MCDCKSSYISCDYGYICANFCISFLRYISTTCFPLLSILILFWILFLELANFFISSASYAFFFFFNSRTVLLLVWKPQLTPPPPPAFSFPLSPLLSPSFLPFFLLVFFFLFENFTYISKFSLKYYKALSCLYHLF